jgi:nucleoid-associated protein YgaU
MGFFDFVKEAGKKLGLGEEEAPQPMAKERDPEEIKRLNERRRAMGLVKRVEGLGFEIADLSIRVDGDVATVSGTVKSQEDKEKIVLAIGNTAGIARVDDRMEVSEPQPEAQFHTVVSGDTLSAIAKQYYGNAMKYPVIFEANKPMLTDPDKIYPGQTLRIPPLPEE